MGITGRTMRTVIKRGGTNMKKEYHEAKIEVLEISRVDVVCDSGEETTKYWEGPIVP